MVSGQQTHCSYCHYLLTGHALDGGTLRQLSPLGLAQVGAEMNAAGAVINPHLINIDNDNDSDHSRQTAYLHVIVPGTLHNQSLQLVMAGEPGQAQQSLHAHRLIHLNIKMVQWNKIF